jgi:pimeloyl-ACP methyl ester carboxylesterase
LELERQNSFAGDLLFSSVAKVCQGWPKFTAPANFAQAVNSTIPTLLLSGELDPITPPAWGELAAKNLSNAKHYVAKQAAHGLVTQTCAAAMVSEFLEQTSFDDIDARCLDDMPQRRFLLNVNGNR